MSQPGGILGLGTQGSHHLRLTRSIFSCVLIWLMYPQTPVTGTLHHHSPTSHLTPSWLTMVIISLSTTNGLHRVPGATAALEPPGEASDKEYGLNNNNSITGRFKTPLTRLYAVEQTIILKNGRSTIHSLPLPPPSTSYRPSAIGHQSATTKLNPNGFVEIMASPRPCNTTYHPRLCIWPTSTSQLT